VRRDLAQEVHPVVSAASGGAVYVAPDPEPEGARIWFFSRRGGVSKKPYDSLNVSSKVGDDPAAVEKNRSLIREAMDGKPSAWSRQVHADGVVRVSKAGSAGEADALITEEAGFSLVVAVADCVPVVLVGERGVGMAHSGWRGTLLRVAGKTARELGEASLRAYVGPCIRGCCYEGPFTGRNLAAVARVPS
jgi:YfiH family protein